MAVVVSVFWESGAEVGVVVVSELWEAVGEVVAVVGVGGEVVVGETKEDGEGLAVVGLGNPGNGSCLMILLLPESMASSKASSSSWIECICASVMTLHVLVGFLDIIQTDRYLVSLERILGSLILCDTVCCTRAPWADRHTEQESWCWVSEIQVIGVTILLISIHSIHTSYILIQVRAHCSCYTYKL